MAVLRKGANGWSCMDPDGTAPMCADANAMEWLHALVSKCLQDRPYERAGSARKVLASRNTPPPQLLRLTTGQSLGHDLPGATDAP